MSHMAQAIALTCIDFRFRKPIHDFLENQLNLHSVDIKTDAGGVKKLVDDTPVREWIFENFEIAYNLHGVDRVILINHQDCGAFGGSKAFASLAEEINFHETILRHAVSVVRSKWPRKDVEAYLALIDDNEQVSFEKVV